MNYYRKIGKSINDLKYKMQIAALTLKINEDKSDIKTLEDNNLLKINSNKINISNNLEKINDISNNLTKEIFNEKYIVESKNFSFDKNTHFFNIIEINIKNDFKIDDVIKINANSFYGYDNIKNDYHRLEHEYEIYADNILFFKKIIGHKQFYIDDAITMKKKFDVAIEDDFEYLTVKLFLHRVNRKGVGNIVLKILDDNNFIDIIYLSKTVDFSLINENEKNISSINTTILNIDKELSSINDFKNDMYDNIAKTNSLILSQRTNYAIDNIYLFNFDKVLEINFKEDINEILIFEQLIDNEFKANSFLEIKESILYQFDDIKLAFNLLQEKYQFYNKNDQLIEEYLLNTITKGIVVSQYQVYLNTFFIKLYKDSKKIKFKLFLQRVIDDDITEILLKMTNELQNNYICLKYLKNNIF